MIHSLKVMMGVIGGALLFASTAFAGLPTSVPEPSTLSLLALGGGGLYWLHRRSRK